MTWCCKAAVPGQGFPDDGCHTATDSDSMRLGLRLKQCCALEQAQHRVGAMLSFAVCHSIGIFPVLVASLI